MRRISRDRRHTRRCRRLHYLPRTPHDFAPLCTCSTRPRSTEANCGNAANAQQRQVQVAAVCWPLPRPPLGQLGNGRPIFSVAVAPNTRKTHPLPICPVASGMPHTDAFWCPLPPPIRTPRTFVEHSRVSPPRGTVVSVLSCTPEATLCRIGLRHMPPPRPERVGHAQISQA